MKIYLVRHGETDWNLRKILIGQKDIPLNETGRYQAQSLKEQLKDIDFDCCFSSPLSRAKETAEIICDGKCKIIFDDDLKERYGGNTEGKTLDSWDDYENNKTKETDAEILTRANNFLERIKKTDYNTILIVSHNGLLKNLRHCILGKAGTVDYSDNFKNCGFEIYQI